MTTPFHFGPSYSHTSPGVVGNCAGVRGGYFLAYELLHHSNHFNGGNNKGPNKDSWGIPQRRVVCFCFVFFILSICKQNRYQENDTRKTAFYFTVILGNSTKIPLSRSEVVMPPAEGWMINLFIRVTCKRTAPYWDVCKGHQGDPFFFATPGLYKTARTPSHLWFNMDWVWVGSSWVKCESVHRGVMGGSSWVHQCLLFCLVFDSLHVKHNSMLLFSKATFPLIRLITGHTNPRLFIGQKTLPSVSLSSVYLT